MAHMLGYARVSTTEQNPDLQVDELTSASCWKVWTDRAAGALDRRPQLDVGGRLLRLAEEQARARGLREVRRYTNEAMLETLATTCGAATDSEPVQAAAETVHQRAADVLADAPLSWSWAAVGRTGDVLEQQADAVDAYLMVVGHPPEACVLPWTTC